MMDDGTKVLKQLLLQLKSLEKGKTEWKKVQAEINRLMESKAAAKKNVVEFF